MRVLRACAIVKSRFQAQTSIFGFLRSGGPRVDSLGLVALTLGDSSWEALIIENKAGIFVFSI
jgi:hypothetical protein